MALLPRDAALAERQAWEILRVQPKDARALFVVAAARRRQGDPATARVLLERLTQADRNLWRHYEPWLGALRAVLP